MKSLFKQNAVFIGLSLILIAVLGLALLWIPKGELHLLLCDHHTPARDIFYKYYTTLAEWFPYVVCIAILLFGCVGDGVFASSAMILSALVTQLVKHILNAPRPVTWFAEHMSDIQLPITEGVKIHHWYSFPSGHTTSFFALAFVASILLTRIHRIPMTPRILVQILLFALATLGGYSRLYLSQHFAIDVFAGIIIGTLTTALCYAVFAKYSEQKWYNYHFFAKKT